MSKVVRKVRVLIVLLGAAVVFGCATDASAPPPETSAPKFATEYLIGVGDGLQVSVWRHPDLSAEVPVRPDGRISIPVVGDIMVGGLTPERVAEQIKASLSEYVRDPVVTVIVANTGSNEYLSRVRITGAVSAPQSIPYRSGMTVMDVVLDAGGINQFANPAKTILYRKSGEKIKIRLDRILTKGDLSSNFEVLPGDVITVPESLF